MANTVAELVFIPAPGLGHIMSTMEIAKLLVNRDQHLSITVLVITPHSLSSGSAVTTYNESLSKISMDRISFIELPQDETPPMSDSKSPMTFFTEYINSHRKYVRNAMADIISKLAGTGRVVGLVTDILCFSMVDVANEFHIPSYIFMTSNAAFLGYNLYILRLCDDQNQDFFELRNSDTEIPISSFVKPVPTKVFPSIVRTKQDMEIVMQSIRKLREVRGIIVNTFEELETYAIESLSADASLPPVYPVGPLLNLSGAGARKSFDSGIIEWLDTQPPSSVVFLCFGSMGSFDEIQVKEIARALEKSGLRFLWSLRRPPSDQSSMFPGEYENPGSVLPQGFLERTAGIGKVIGWAPQVTLLAHPAVGGFVTHCGWNSMMESLWFGVPTATWPLYAEQQMNAFEMVVELGLAVEIKLDYNKEWVSSTKVAETVVVTADEIEIGIRKLMEDNEVRTKVKAMSEKSRSAVAEGGSSYASVGRLIHEFIENIS